MTDHPIAGIYDPRFERVRDAFADNFRLHGETGAGCCVMLAGKCVADIWGGTADAANTRPWTEHTLVNVFSVGKALVALAALRIVEGEGVDLDRPAARLWPEFARAGKEAITLRQLLCHQGALPAIAEPLPDGAALNWQCIAAALERQAPWWQPGTAFGYHVNTYGFLIGELVRRATGNTLGALIRERIAGPLDLDLHIGLAESEHSRVAEFRWPESANSAVPKPPEGATGLALARWLAYWNPPGFSGAHWVNRREWRLAEIPSTNAHGTARSVAKLYAALAKGGELDGVRIVSRALLGEATREQSYGQDLINDRPARFGLGFLLTMKERPLGPNPNTFGHFGAGGSLGFCDPDAGLAFGYVTNDMGPRWQNPRNRGLIEACYACL